jgi:hypothetical protein
MIPDSFFTIEMLGTYAGATIATALIVQYTKDLPGVKLLPTRAWAYVVAAVLLLLSTVFSSTVTVDRIILTFINAVIVAMAAVGGYDTLNRLRTSDKT